MRRLNVVRYLQTLKCKRKPARKTKKKKAANSNKQKHCPRVCTRKLCIGHPSKLGKLRVTHPPQIQVGLTLVPQLVHLRVLVTKTQLASTRQSAHSSPGPNRKKFYLLKEFCVNFLLLLSLCSDLFKNRVQFL